MLLAECNPSFPAAFVRQPTVKDKSDVTFQINIFIRNRALNCNPFPLIINSKSDSKNIAEKNLPKDNKLL